MNKPTQQQVIESYKKLPPSVREFLADPDQLARVLTSIKNAHNLHVDVIGLVNESIGYLLLGLASPSEFKNMLKIAGIPEGTVNDIINEINQKIFVPLREEMRKSPPAEVKPPQQQTVAASAPPRPAVFPQRTTIIPANPNLPQRPAQTLASVPRYVPPKKYFNLQNKIPPPSSIPAHSIPASQNLQASSLQPPVPMLLEDHEEPHIDISEKVQVVSQPAIQRKVYEPPPNLPGAIYHPPIPKPIAPVAPYSADPYREPIDEK